MRLPSPSYRECIEFITPGAADSLKYAGKFDPFGNGNILPLVSLGLFEYLCIVLQPLVNILYTFSICVNNAE